MSAAFSLMRETLRTRSTVWFLLAALAFLYLSLFIPPSTPIYSAGDSSVYLLNATRMFEGESIYRDFFQFTLPGTELFYLALFKLVGPRVWIPNVTLIVLGLGLTALIMYVSRRVLTGWIAFLPALLFLTFVYWQWLDPSHHWFSTLIVMGAVAVLIERRTLSRLALAGAICGLATFFTQMKGVTGWLGVAVFLLWEGRYTREKSGSLLVKELTLLTPFVVTLATASAYFIWNAGWQRFLYCTVEFGIRYYPRNWSNNLSVYVTGLWPLGAHWYTALRKLAVFLFLHALFPLVFVLFFMRCRRRVSGQPSEPWDRLMLVSIVGLFLFIGVARAPAWTRLDAVSPPALILAVWLMKSWGKLGQAALGCLGLFAMALALVEPRSRQREPCLYLPPPGPQACLRQGRYEEEYRWVFDRTRPSEYILEGNWPTFYFLLGLRNPAKVPFLSNTDYTRPEQVADVIESLERHRVCFVLWSLSLDLYDPRDPPGGDHLGPLRAYLRTHYHVAKTFADDEFWERNP
jgi:hypothetical protein